MGFEPMSSGAKVVFLKLCMRVCLSFISQSAQILFDKDYLVSIFHLFVNVKESDTWRGLL